MPDDHAYPSGDITLDQVTAALSLDMTDRSSSDFDLNADTPDQITQYRPAAVLIPILQAPNGLRVILTRRAAHLKHHPGQIAFPGGKVETSDLNAEAAALRESWEEIGLDPKKAQIHGRLPPHKTVTGFEVQPFVALIDPDFSPRTDPGEVEEVFSVPLSHVLNPNNFFIEGRTWMGRPRQYYVVPYGPYYIWGATARMLRMFTDCLERSHENLG